MSAVALGHPGGAIRLLHDTIAERATVASLSDEDGAWPVVRNLVRSGLIGGIAHDAHVVACAQAAVASALATLNRRDLARLDLAPVVAP